MHRCCAIGGLAKTYAKYWTTKPVIWVIFLEIEIYTSSESWINKLSIDVSFVIWPKSGIWGSKKNLNIENIAFKFVQIMFLAMHITYQKLRFDIFTVVHL